MVLILAGGNPTMARPTCGMRFCHFPAERGFVPGQGLL